MGDGSEDSGEWIKARERGQKMNNRNKGGSKGKSAGKGERIESEKSLYGRYGPHTIQALGCPNALKISQTKRIRRGKERWSSLMGCYCLPALAPVNFGKHGGVYYASAEESSLGFSTNGHVCNILGHACINKQIRMGRQIPPSLPGVPPSTGQHWHKLILLANSMHFLIRQAVYRERIIQVSQEFACRVLAQMMMSG